MGGFLGPLAAGFVVAVEVVAVALAARRLGRWFDPTGDGWDRALAALVAGLGGTIALLTVAGMVGLLRRPVIPVLVIGAALAVLTLVPDPGPATTRSPLPRATAALLAAVAGAALGWFLAPGLAGTSQEDDTLHYHVANLGTWLHQGHLWTLPFAVPGYFTNAYPSAYELSAAVLMAPTGSDQLVYVAVLPWAALAVVAVAVAARELGGGVTGGTVMGLAVVLAPLVVRTQAAALTSDLAASAAVVAAVALVLRARDPATGTRLGALAGVAVGLALATKYTTFAGGLGVVVLALLVLPKERRKAITASIIGGAASLGGFWLVRNLVATGNPLYPLGLGPLEGGESPLTRFDLPLIRHVTAGRTDPLRTWWRLARSLLGPVLVVLPLALVALFRPAERARFLVGGLALALLLGYALTPYTGGGDDGVAFLIGSQLRYALPAIMLAAPVAVALLGRATTPVAAAVLAWDAWMLHRPAGFRTDVDLHGATVAWAIVLAAVGAALVLLPDALRRLPDDRVRTLRPLAIGAAVVLAGLGVAAVLRVQGAEPTSPVEQVLAHIDRPHGPVAVAYVSDLRTVLGRRFQIDAVGANAGGAADERPVLDGPALDRAVLALDAPVLALDRSSVPTLPPGWHPAAPWRLVATQGSTQLYVRTDLVGNGS